MMPVADEGRQQESDRAKQTWECGCLFYVF